MVTESKSRTDVNLISQRFRIFQSFLHFRLIVYNLLIGRLLTDITSIGRETRKFLFIASQQSLQLFFCENAERSTLSRYYQIQLSIDGKRKKLKFVYS